MLIFFISNPFKIIPVSKVNQKPKKLFLLFMSLLSNAIISLEVSPKSILFTANPLGPRPIIAAYKFSYGKLFLILFKAIE